MLTMTIMLMHVMDVMASVSQRYLKRLVTIWRRNIGPGCSLSELLSRPVATTSRTEPTDGRLFCRRCCPDFTCDRYNLRTTSPYYLLPERWHGNTSKSDCNLYIILLGASGGEPQFHKLSKQNENSCKTVRHLTRLDFVNWSSNSIIIIQ